MALDELPGGRFPRQFGQVGGEPPELAGVRGDDVIFLQQVRFSEQRQEVQRVGIQHGRDGGLGDQFQQTRRKRPVHQPQARTDDEGIGAGLQQVQRIHTGVDDDFRRALRGDRRDSGRRHMQMDQPSPAVQRATGRKHRRACERGRTRQNRDFARHAFVEIKWPRGFARVDGERRNQVEIATRRRRERLHRHDGQRAGGRRRRSGEQAAFGCADHERDVRRHGVGGDFSGIGIDAGRQVHGGHAGSGMIAQPRHFAGQAEQRFPQGAAGTDAEQPVQQHQRVAECAPIGQGLQHGLGRSLPPHRAGQRSPLGGGKRRAGNGVPAVNLLENPHRDDGIAGVVTLAEVADDRAGSGEKRRQRVAEPAAGEFEQACLRPALAGRIRFHRPHFRCCYRAHAANLAQDRHGGERKIV